MADGVKENTLTTVTDVNQNDSVRLIGSDNASKKALLSAVSKSVVEEYNGTSLAGSSQTIKSAVDALNSNLGRIKQVFVKAGTSGQNGTTDTVTLDAQGLYMVCISRINSSTAVAGMYLVTPYSGNTSNITAIKEAGTNVGTVAVSGLDVSITYAANYVNATIIKLV